MEYRGNPSLPLEIRERIQSTFEQTLGSAREGNYQEALLGCDFILRLDPDFTPAKELAERLEQLHAGAQGGVPLATQEIPTSIATAAQAAASVASIAPAPPEISAAPAPDSGGLASELERMLQARELEPLMQFAHQHQQTVLADPQLRNFVEQAQARLEAEPYVVNFLDSATQMLEMGQMSEAEKLVEKATSLDPSHPRLAEVEQLRQVILQKGVGAQAPASPEIPATAIPAPELPQDPEVVASEGFSGEGAAATTDELDPFSLEPDELDPFSMEEDDPFALDEPAGEAVAPGGDDTQPAMEGVGGEEPAALPSFEEPDSEDDPFALGDGEVDPFGMIDEDPPATGDSAVSVAAPEASGGDERVAELLAEGQASFDQGEYQSAIDAWSRIFLIDIDHEDATRRIDQARQLKAEQERQTEEIFHEGLELIKVRDLEGSKEAFAQVLALQPGHVAAQEYLQQLEAGEFPELTGIGAAPKIAADLSLAEMEEASDPSTDELKEEILVPPDPGAIAQVEPSAGSDKPKGKPAAGARKKFFLIGAGVLALVSLLAIYLFVFRDGLFGNLGSDGPPAQSQQMPKLPKMPDPIAEAQRLYDEGEVEQALTQLKLLAPESPRHEEAQTLITEWEAQRAPQLTPEVEERRELALAEAYQYFNTGEFMRAEEAFGIAAEIAPLEEVDTNRLEEVKLRLKPMSREIALFRAREWNLVLKDLWQMHLNEPENRDIVRMIRDCYYNLAVQDLQRGNSSGAEEKFSEVLELAADDEVARRHLLFAQTYQQREPDLLYRIYVKYLPFR